jgi:hypothetical protein
MEENIIMNEITTPGLLTDTVVLQTLPLAYQQRLIYEAAAENVSLLEMLHRIIEHRYHRNMRVLTPLALCVPPADPPAALPKNRDEALVDCDGSWDVITLPGSNLVIVDAEIAADAREYTWHYNGGTVRRNEYDPATKISRKVTLYSLVLGMPAGPASGRVYHLNGDVMDYRRANLLYIPNDPNTRPQSRAAVNDVCRRQQHKGQCPACGLPLPYQDQPCPQCARTDAPLPLLEQNARNVGEHILTVREEGEEEERLPDGLRDGNDGGDDPYGDL